MTSLQRWAKEKKCCCNHPERYACAEDQARRQLPIDDMVRASVLDLEEIEPCECCCHGDFFEDDEGN